MSFEKYMHHITTFPKVHFHQSSNFLHTPLCGQPLSTTLHSCHFYHHRLVLLALQPHINGTISVCILQCLAYFTQYVTEINLCCVSKVHYFLNGWIVFHCMDITVYPFICWCSSLRLLWLKMLWTLMYKYFCGLMFWFLLDEYLYEKLLGHMPSLCLTV